MTSKSALRIWRVASASGNWPTFSDDDYINYVVTEAVVFKGMENDREQSDKAAKEQEHKRFRESRMSAEQAAQARPTTPGVG